MAEAILRGGELKSKDFLKSIGQLFFDISSKYPNNTCQIDPQTDRRETFADMKKRSVRVAIELMKRGVTSKDVVVFCSKNSIDNMIPILACFYLGAKVANFDPALTTRHTQHLLSITTPSVVFVEEASVKLMEEAMKKLDISAKMFVFSGDKYEKFSDLLVPSVDEDNFKPVQVDLHDTAVMFFSSGSTGLPKAICHTHYSFLHIIETLREGNLFSHGALLCLSTFYWISASIFTFATFCSGLPRIITQMTSAENIFNIVEKYKVGTIFMVPMLTYELTKSTTTYDISSVRVFLTGGMPISPIQLKSLQDVFRSSKVVVGYGMTEIGQISETDHLEKPDSCGRIAPGIDLKVVDLETREVQGPNKSGEICVRSNALMKGYYKAQEDNFDSEGFLKTGDIGYYDEDKDLYVVGRAKEMFKSLGWPIVPSSIENVLLEHPGIKEAVVMGIPTETEETPAACVVLYQDYALTEEEIEDFVAGRVADWERLRGGVVIVDEIPKTPSNKVMRKEIRSFLIKHNMTVV